ncbi:hypothetical protein JAAARDRAFT_75729 [Jaapia argillacea MUCL 33604]|uniref:Homeobox domain-containing protein n=1 Tax=Jaapia argillacea MUCL 33604 TaxID=933084 RepID=A0A067QAV2_9AGAM|nr:hypothetical protein JAAARDRAFT_75729 [Jaapia argillacea MUCL 33604]
MPPTGRSRLTDAFSHILQTGDELKKLSQAAVSSSMLTQAAPSPSVQVTLPEPPPIYGSLVSLGLQPALAETLSAKYARRAGDLRLHAESTISRALTKLAMLPRHTSLRPQSELDNQVSVVYRGQYLRTVQNLAKETVDLATAFVSRRSEPCRDSVASTPTRDDLPQARATFNQEYLPMLEFAFKENPFPSHADKAAFAKKSGMTYRQIHVWFQNRRSRAKRDGVRLRKVDINNTTKFNFDPLISRLKDEGLDERVIPEGERVKPVDSDASEYEWHYFTSDDEEGPAAKRRTSFHANSPDPFSYQTPSHTFPTPYPPVCEVEPFPIKDGIHHLPPPVWPRKPVAQLAAQPPVDMDTFAEAFAKLSVRVGPIKIFRKKPEVPRKSSKPKRTSTPPPKPDRSAATSAITTKPMPAPLPSFVSVKRRRLPTLTITPASPLPGRTIPTSTLHRLHAFRTPSPKSAHASLVAEALRSNQPAPRKVAPLPQRAAAHTRPRGVSPIVSDATISPQRSRSSTLEPEDHFLPLSSPVGRTAMNYPRPTQPYATRRPSPDPARPPPSRTSQVIPYSTSTSSTTPAVRKVAGLPRRHLDASPAASTSPIKERLPSHLSSTSQSRASSFGSNTLGRIWVRSVSDSGSPSSEDEASPATPPLQPIHIATPSLSTPGFSFNPSASIDDLFGDDSSPAEGLQLELQSMGGHVLGKSTLYGPGLPGFNAMSSASNHSHS